MTDAQRGFFLFIGILSQADALPADRLKAARIPFKRKSLNSSQNNWYNISSILQHPELKGAVVKLSGRVYRLISDPAYQDAARKFFAALGSVPHITFVHEAILRPNDWATRKDSQEEDMSLFGDSRSDYELAFAPPTAEQCAVVDQFLNEHQINVVVYRTNAELSVLATAFIDDNEKNLLFRLYVPSGRLYAAEADKLLTLFREWLAKLGRHGVRHDGYRTAAGQVYEFFGTESLNSQELSREFDEFSGFLDLCINDTEAATLTLTGLGLDRRSATDLVSRYGKEVRRLQLDLRQERESRILGIRHSLESEFLDMSSSQAAPPIAEVDGLINALVPSAAPTPMSVLAPVTSASSVTVNISQQFVSAVEGVVLQSIQGTAHLGVEAKELLKLVDLFGERDRVALQSAVHEIEDPDARETDRLGARQKLKRFLLQLGGKVEDAALTALTKYVETKLGY